MKKSWMLFLMVFLTGAVNMVEAVRGHRACIEQREHESRNYVMSSEYERKCAIIEETKFKCCCLIPRYRTRHLASLQEVIKIGDNLRYFDACHVVDDGFSDSVHFFKLEDDKYEYWKVVTIDTQNNSFKERLINSHYLTKNEKNYEAMQTKMMRDK